MPGFEWMREPRHGTIAFRANDPQALRSAATAGLPRAAVAGERAKVPGTRRAIDGQPFTAKLAPELGEVEWLGEWTDCRRLPREARRRRSTRAQSVRPAPETRGGCRESIAACRDGTDRG